MQNARQTFPEGIFVGIADRGCRFTLASRREECDFLTVEIAEQERAFVRVAIELECICYDAGRFAVEEEADDVLLELEEDGRTVSRAEANEFCYEELRNN